MKKLAILALLATALASCTPDTPTPTPTDPADGVTQITCKPFHFKNPEERTPAYAVASEAHRLYFFGWGEQTDKAFQLELPSDVSDIDRVLLEYRMGAWGERPEASGITLRCSSSRTKVLVNATKLHAQYRLTATHSTAIGAKHSGLT